MSKPVRLLQLLTLLTSRRTAITAKQLAEVLEVSERTVYRDIQSLILAGVPVEGEAGVGYLLTAEAQLPPLMFNHEELLALQLGIKMVQAWSDPGLAKSATHALNKIASVLPPILKSRDPSKHMLVPDYFVHSHVAERQATIRAAIEDHQELSIQYRRADDEESQRVVQPLGLVFWGEVWMLVSWCTLRNDYRNFRLDRMLALEVLEQTFTPVENRSLDHYLALMRTECDEKHP